MSNLTLLPHFVLLQEDFEINGPEKMAYRAQSSNFNFIFNQGRLIKQRSPMKTVGIMVTSAAVDPFFCKAEDLHLVFLSAESIVDVTDPLVPGPVWNDQDDFPF